MTKNAGGTWTRVTGLKPNEGNYNYFTPYSISAAAQQKLQAELQRRSLSLQVVVRPGWYF